MTIFIYYNYLDILKEKDVKLIIIVIIIKRRISKTEYIEKI